MSRVTDAITALKVLKNADAHDSWDTLRRSAEDGARSIMVRERLLWAIGCLLNYPEKAPATFTRSATLYNTCEAVDDFYDRFYDDYVWGCLDCAFFDQFRSAFEPFGTVIYNPVTTPCEVWDEAGYLVEDASKKIEVISSEELMHHIVEDEKAALAVPELETLFRSAIDFDPDNEYSLPMGLMLKSERIGRFLMSGKSDKEVNELLNILSQPVVSDYLCFHGVYDGVWYCGTIMGMIDEVTTISWDSVNPAFVSACIVLEDILERHERKRRNERRQNEKCVVQKRFRPHKRLGRQKRRFSRRYRGKCAAKIDRCDRGKGAA